MMLDGTDRPTIYDVARIAGYRTRRCPGSSTARRRYARRIVTASLRSLPT